MHLVVINTAGKQRYIFSSRKRKEIVGASDLIARVDGSWAEEALAKTFDGFRRSWRVAAGDPAELITAGAGAISVLVQDPAAGRRLVGEVTGRALAKAPGLDVCGVVCEANGSFAEDMAKARAELAAVQEARPGPLGRFLRLPMVEDCESSGQPASELRREAPEERPAPRSAASAAKLDHYPQALERLARDAETDRRTMAEIVDHLGLKSEWVAVVHADGNGFGQLFSGLGDLLGDPDNSTYVDALRKLSGGVDECARRAFRVALNLTAGDHPDQLVGGRRPPVLPLVLGGDDLTVLCQGEVALTFTRHYLEAFEKETAADENLSAVLEKSRRTELSAAAGVAIVKRNYPFRFAYDLAEELISTEAKGVKEWGSGIAFAVLLESSAPDLRRLRRSVTLPGGSSASLSPYVVGKGGTEPRAEGRRWEDLRRRVAALRSTHPDTGELLVPRSAVHDLCEGLCLGADVARARLSLLRTRLGDDQARLSALADLSGGPELTGESPQSEVALTGLTDALAALPFFPKERA